MSDTRITTEQFAEGWPEIQITIRSFGTPFGAYSTWIVRCGGLVGTGPSEQKAVDSLRSKLELSRIAKEAE